jgi:hypothetical protein
MYTPRYKNQSYGVSNSIALISRIPLSIQARPRYYYSDTPDATTTPSHATPPMHAADAETLKTIQMPNKISL